MFFSKRLSRRRLLRSLAIFCIVVLSSAMLDGKVSLAVADQGDTMNAGRGGGGGKGGGGGRGGDGKKGERKKSGAGPSDPASRMYTEALALKQAGHCDKAIPIFECMVRRGQGFEIAALPLGQCSRDQGRLSDGEERQAHFTRALYWLDWSANRGDASAQGEMSQAYLDGELADKDLVAAGKWYLLFERNPVRQSLGFGKLPKGTKTLVQQELSDDDWAGAEAVVMGWTKVMVSEPIPSEILTSDECARGVPRPPK